MKINYRFLIGVVLICTGAGHLYLFWVESFSNPLEVIRSLKVDGTAPDGAFALFGIWAMIGALGLSLGNYFLFTSRNDHKCQRKGG